MPSPPTPTRTKKCIRKMCGTTKKGKMVDFSRKTRKTIIQMFQKIKQKTPQMKKTLRRTKSKKYLDKLIKDNINDCRKAYCNPGCKKTIYDPNSSFYSKYIAEKFKLHGDFNEQLDRNKLEKEGAISGCMANVHAFE